MDSKPSNQSGSSIGVGRIYLARFVGCWYLGEWDGVQATIILDKSPLMPGDEFRPRNRQLGTTEMMSRAVPKQLVEIVPILKYRGIPVYIDGLDDTSATLKMRLCRVNGYDYGEKRVDLSVLPRDGWRISDSRDQIYYSPYIDVDDPRLERVLGELR